MRLQIMIAAITITVLSLAAATILATQLSIWRSRANQLTTYVKVSEDSATFYKNKYGQVVAEKQTIELDRHNIKQLKTQLDEYASHFTHLNKRLNNLESLLKTQATASRTFQMGVKDTIIVVDGIETEMWEFENENPHFAISGYVVAFPDSMRKVVATPSLTMNLYGAEAWTRKKILGLKLGRKQYSYQITTDNPYVQIMDVEFIKKKQ